MQTQAEYKQTGTCPMCKGSNPVETNPLAWWDGQTMGRELACMQCGLCWVTMYKPDAYDTMSSLLDCAECKKDVEVEELEWDFKNGLVCKDCRYPNRERQLNLPL